MNIDERFFACYVPLVKQFCTRIGEPLSDQLAKTPQPFFPAFGTRYANAPLRIAFVGMETRGWGNAKEFVEKARLDPEAVLRAELDSFRELDFCRWTNNFGYTFFDFVLFVLARLHKLPDFKVLKRKLNANVLQSFAWGNCNAIERYEVTARNYGVPYDVWRKAKEASEPVDRARFLIESLQPDVLIVLWKGMTPSSYLDGLDCTHLTSSGDFDHFSVDSGKVHAFRIPHPQNMWRRRGRDYYADKLASAFAEHKLMVEFPGVIQASEDSDRFIRSLAHSIPRGLSKYDCVEWLAARLGDQNNVMTIPALAFMLNDLGYRTNYGTEYQGGRGTYRLVKCVYDRCDARGHHDAARKVAEAFVKPTGDYAYD